jgi:hypothetical protein
MRDEKQPAAVGIRGNGETEKQTRGGIVEVV